jgi:hypothetical protein
MRQALLVVIVAPVNKLVYQNTHLSPLIPLSHALPISHTSPQLAKPQPPCHITHNLATHLTLTLTSESVYGSQFFQCKLLQVLMS